MKTHIKIDKKMNTITSPNRSQVLQLYRRFLRVGNQWPRWETPEVPEKDQVSTNAFLGDFIIQKSKKEFRKNQQATSEIGTLLEKARKELRFLQILQADIFKKQFVLKRNYSEAAEEIKHD